MNTTQNNLDSCEPAKRCSQPLTHFFIYENLDLISDRVFEQDEITIGSSQDADLFLDHQSVADIHAMVHHKNDQVFLTNHFPQNGLRLNGRSVGLAELQHEDVIDIGPFSLKIKMPEPKPEETPQDNATYVVRLVNRYGSARALEAAAGQLARILKAGSEKILPLLSKEFFILKKGLNGIEAARVQNTLLKAGVICDVQMEATELALSIASDPIPAEPAVSEPQPSRIIDAEASSVAPDCPAIKELRDTEPETPPAHVSFTELFIDDEDEDDEQVWEAPFSLRAKLDLHTTPPASAQRLPEQLQVVKTIGESVVDVRYLQGRQKYFIDTDKGRFCLTGAKGEGFVSLHPDFSGFIQSPSGEATADLDSYKTPEYLFRQRKSIYRIPLPDKDAVVIEAGGCRYRIAQVQATTSAQVAVVNRASDFSWRYWASSAGTHFFLLLCMTVYMYFQAGTPKPTEPHFVKIDLSMLQQLQAPKVPPKPKPPPPPPKPEPRKVAKQVEPQKKKPVKKKAPPKVAQSRKTRKKGARTGQVGKHPKAGGGFGKGNIKNRNINQTGILSVLSSSSLGGPSQAIASVTNLDAVAVPGATKKNFSVGGLKGALGNGKIAVASGAIMQTKGSSQVLRSAGARGKGTVAALERGTTGKKKVRSMVTAKMSRTVKIEGGMSREMVKRVIDQHLEEITFCYETALMSNPGILGRIVFEWKILMSGRVGEMRIIASSVHSHEIHDCIKTAIKSWQFPKPVGAEVVVSYPFVFDLVTF